MISSELFSNQEICHIDLNGEKIISSVSTYIKESLSIIEIDNKKCQKCSKLKTPVEVVYDKLIMFLEGIPTSNEYRPIDYPNLTAIKKGTVVLDEIFQKYFDDSLLHDVICDHCSSLVAKSIKSTLAVSRHIKEPPTVLNIIFQRGSYDSTTFVTTKN